MHNQSPDLIDLHVHSSCSDGTCTPEQVVQLAVAAGLKAIALTDHDTAAGVERACAAARETGSGLLVIPGIELSAQWQNQEIHILGLNLDPTHPDLLSYQEEFLREREERNRRMAEKITAVGCSITVEEVKQRFPGAILGRPHYARVMMEKGFVKSIQAAFNGYLGDRGPCFVSRRRIAATDALKLILSCGGHPVLAHPLQYGFSRDRLESFVDYLKNNGLQGMECLYSAYNASESAKLTDMARRHGLFITGGTDFHGENKPDIALGRGIKGNLAVPFSLLKEAGIC
ncbi:MAG: PHP domain-containing protein [Lachnospiraceae bacterium]|nr:PHP domain-containing protein [Lachnospiraceae bacterium]